MNKNLISSALYLIAAICLFYFAYSFNYTFLYIGIIFLAAAIFYSKKANKK